MKTALYTLSYLDGNDALGNSRIERMKRFLRYYDDLSEELGFSEIIISDNGSENSCLELTRELKLNNKITVYSLPHLDFGSTLSKEDPRHHLDYPYCWRGIGFMDALFRKHGLEKIIFIDTDGFVLSHRLGNKIRDFKSGWATVWCKRHRFPEASLQVVTRMAFNRLKSDWRANVGRMMEWAIPFTEVWTELNCDRFGEDNAVLNDSMDFYGQAGPEIKPEYK